MIRAHVEVERSSRSVVERNDIVAQLSIPYTKGWTAYVDGKKTPIYQTNYMYSGIALDTGEQRGWCWHG